VGGIFLVVVATVLTRFVTGIAPAEPPVRHGARSISQRSP
jgi:hypothetical protein